MKIKASKNEPYVLALDHGTSGCKVALVTISGKVVDMENGATRMQFLPGGGAEQDPEEWWRAFTGAARRLLKRHHVSRARVDAVCVSSTFSSTVAVDRNGRHLMNSLTWMDSRGAKYIHGIMGGFPSVDGYNLGRIMSWIRRTGGGPTLSGKDDIAHVLLTKHDFPEVYEKTHQFLGSKDYFNLRLTGEFAATHDSVMLFWVTDIRDINNIDYSDRLIKILDIDREKLPRLIRSIDTVGTLLPTVAAELGLRKGLPVIAGSPDHQSALVGSGAVRDFEGHLYIGTSSWIECIVPFKKTDMFHSIASLPTAIPGKYQCINEQDIAGGALNFLLNNILYHESEFYRARRPRDLYRKLDDTVRSVAPGSGRLIFTPWLNGERTPFDSTTLRGVLYNISMTTGTDTILRAVLEGVAYNTRWSLGYVEKFIGRKMDTLNMVGGGAKSDAWCAIFADVLQRRIRKVKDPIGANARGAAYIAAVGLGHIRFDDIPGLTEYEAEFEPDPKNRDIYDLLFREFVEIYRKNKPIFFRLNG